MAGHGAKLGRKQEDVIAALLSQRSIEEAAHVAGVSVRSLLRWMKIPKFDAAYRKARSAAFSQSIARLQQASSAAVSVLVKTMIDPSTPPSTKVRAADSVLAHAARAIEIEDIERRLTQLEEVAEQTRSMNRQCVQHT